MTGIFLALALAATPSSPSATPPKRSAALDRARAALEGE